VAMPRIQREAGGEAYIIEPRMSTRLTTYRRRSSRALKEQNFTGQASWISSNVNLVNTIIGAGTLGSIYLFNSKCALANF
jgi:hypothetical protein